jgi:DnaK suppressor protein
MDFDRFRRRLLEEERKLVDAAARAEKGAREPAVDDVRDAGDESVADNLRETSFKAADASWTQLKDVRAALQALEQGGYGRCIVCDRTIEEKRLEAAPWTPYCMEHQEELERSSPVRTPTL